MMRYQFKGVRFYQAELNYREFERVKAIMQGKMDAFKLPDEKYSKVVNELYDRGILKDLFQVILKQDVNGQYAEWINKRRARRAGMDFDNIIASLTGSEVARVLTDFFLCNKAWTTNLLLLSNALSSPSRMTFGVSLRSNLKRWYIALREKISSSKKQ